MGTSSPAASTPQIALTPKKATILPSVVAVSNRGDLLPAIPTSLTGAATLGVMTTWEYTITPLPLHTPKDVLDTWGSDGWELVTVTPAPNGTGHVAYLKRPKQ
ncbi:hypothetical protein GCM10027591_03990 [Zhihengliuella somnathii]